LGIRSYEAAGADPVLKAIEQALAVIASWIFVGCGSGLSDPNFIKLRQWMEEVLSSTQSKHFRLCLTKETAHLRYEHKKDQVAVIPYGDDYPDLPDFLDKLGLTRTPPRTQDSRQPSDRYSPPQSASADMRP